MTFDEELEIYQKLLPKAVFIPCGIDREKSARGESKPWKPAVSNWTSEEVIEELAKESYNVFSGSAAALGILCGEHSNVTILDFDDLLILEAFEKELGAKETWCSLIMKTPSGGFQCFFTYNPKIPLKIINGLDGRNDKSFSWAVVGNAGYSIHHSGDELTAMPQNVEDFVFELTKAKPKKLFEEKKVFYDFSNPLCELVKKVTNAQTISVLDEGEKRTFLARLFEGSEKYFKEATKAGGRNNLTIKLFSIFADDLTISEEFMFSTCVDFVDIFVAPEEGATKKLNAWWKLYSRQFNYDEKWRDRVAEAKKTSSSTATNEEKTAAVRATSSMIDAMFELNTFAGYSLVRGKYFLCRRNSATQKFDVAWLQAKEADKLNPFLRDWYSNAGASFGDVKSFVKVCPVVEDVVSDEMKPFGFFYDDNSLCFNTHYNVGGREHPVAQWEREFKNATLEEVEAIEVSERVRKLIYHPIAKEEHTDYYLASLGEKLCDIFQIPMKHHHITSKTQGTGKSILTNSLIKVLFGAKAHIVNSGALYSQFNTQHANAWAVVYDDVKDFDKHCSEFLKNYVGNSVLTIHSKGKEPYEIANHIFSTGSSNHLYPAKVSNKGERRLAWYPGREEVLDIDAILDDECANVDEFLRIHIREVFALIRSAQLRLNIDPVKPFNVEGMAELVEASNENKMSAVAYLLEKAVNEPGEESIEKLDAACDESAFVDIEAFVSLVKTACDAGSKTFSRKELAATMKRWASREMFRYLAIDGFRLAMRHSKRHGTSVYGVCFGEEEKNIFKSEKSGKIL